MKECSKKKLARSTWAGKIDKMADQKLADRAMEPRKTEIATGIALKVT